MPHWRGHTCGWRDFVFCQLPLDPNKCEKSLKKIWEAYKIRVITLESTHEFPPCFHGVTLLINTSHHTLTMRGWECGQTLSPNPMLSLGDLTPLVPNMVLKNYPSQNLFFRTTLDLVLNGNHRRWSQLASPGERLGE